MRLRFMLSFEVRIKHLLKKRVARDAGKTVRGDHKHQGEGKRKIFKRSLLFIPNQATLDQHDGQFKAKEKELDR